MKAVYRYFVPQREPRLPPPELLIKGEHVCGWNTLADIYYFTLHMLDRQRLLSHQQIEQAKDILLLYQWIRALAATLALFAGVLIFGMLSSFLRNH